jgi:hypothetical protein
VFSSRLYTPLEIALNRAISSLSNHETGSKEYVDTLDAVAKLHKMRQEEKPSSISKDTLLIVTANLLGIILIIKHESVNVITSRAIGLLQKPRI